ncbi:MAG: branched-chain amino acid ABC transporter permease [Eubacteriales bacterium]|nr:branched-chain amino acid ABC transporter permease [Eubacteriales bacterium]
MTFLTYFLNGLQAGSIYALIALGYTMVYGIVKLINFAHGDVMMVGAYVALFSLTTFNLPLWATVLVTMVFTAVLGVVIERFAYKPLRKSARISALITAIGVSLLLQNLVMLVFSPNPLPFPDPLQAAPVFEIGGLKVSTLTIGTIVAAFILMAILTLFITKTRMGKAMRAVSEDTGAAILMGINVNTTISVTFAIGSALASFAAILYVLAYPQIQPYMGSMPGLKAFVAAVLGGIGIIPGAMVGGMVLGIAESLTKGYISSQFSDAVVFGILILVLLFKPSGLFGRNVREKV